MQSTQQGQFIFVSVGSEENAARITHTLLEQNLAACVSRIPKVISEYRWEGELHRDEEILLIIKTQKKLVERVEELIKKVHTYDVPEIVSVCWEQASGEYLAWLLKETE